MWKREIKGTHAECNMNKGMEDIHNKKDSYIEKEVSLSYSQKPLKLQANQAL
jgi:hypothetical protein